MIHTNFSPTFVDYSGEVGGVVPEGPDVQNILDMLKTSGFTKVSTPSHTVPKTRGGKKIRYLVDADTHAYRAAAATDGSQWCIQDVKSGQVYESHKYKKDAIRHQGGYISGETTLVQAWDPEPVSHALTLLKTSLEIFDDRDVEYFVTGKSNFRYDIIKDYKGNRKGRRPANLSDCKQYLLHQGALLNENLEADDLVIIRAKELDALKIPWTIVGCDKDLLQIKGKFYDPFKHKYTTVSEGEARHNLWKQIATGDSTDNIRSPKGLGPAGFNKWFKGTDWEEIKDFEVLQMMVALYKTKVKQETWEHNKDYTLRILMWIKTVASLVFLRRGADEEYQLPTRDGEINRLREGIEGKVGTWGGAPVFPLPIPSAIPASKWTTN